MGKASFVKITFSLVITVIYVFLFGVLETVEGIADVNSEGTDVQEDAEAADEDEFTANTADIGEISFPAYETLDVSNADKPAMLSSFITYPSAAETAYTTANNITDDPEESGAVSEASAADTADYTIDDTEYDVTTTTTTAVTTADAASDDTDDSDEEESEPDSDQLGDTGETLTVYYTGSGGDVTLNAADIIAQIVMAEIGGTFDEEAIKAQAVAAYTYVKYYNDNGKSPYVVVKTPNETVKSCVNEVLGQAVYYNGELIQAVYSASSAGYTASSLSVWKVDYPYLQSVKCELDALYDPNYGVKTTFTSSEIKDYVYNETGIELSGDPGTWFAIKSYVDNVYVGSFSIGGETSYTDSDGNTVEITGRVMREKIMDFNLRSACFEVSYSSDTDKFTFTTYGYGHGVGLSQNGANNLAKYWGYDYLQILEFYYPGTTVS